MKERSKKKDEKDEQFKKFKEMFRKIQVNIPLCEAMDQIPVYDKFMKELLSGKLCLTDDENIVLVEECSVITQRTLPPKLIDSGGFTITCSIGPIKVDRDLCDLGSSINLMPLFVMKMLRCGDSNSTLMTLTLVECSVTYPYGILEDVLVEVDGLVFLVDFVIIDMPEDVETHLIIGIPFMATGVYLIDLKLWELD